MGFFAVAGTISAVKGLASAYGTNRQIENEVHAMEKKRDALRKQGQLIKGQFHAKAAQSQIFGDYEQARIDRIQKFKTSQKIASMGGRGASIGKGGTPWNVILSQKAEDTKNLNLHSYKVKTQTDNLRNEGQKQYDNLYSQSDALQTQIHRTHSQRHERVYTSMLTGGMEGFAQGASMHSAYSSAYPGTSAAPTNVGNPMGYGGTTAWQ